MLIIVALIINQLNDINLGTGKVLIKSINVEKKLKMLNIF